MHYMNSTTYIKPMKNNAYAWDMYIHICITVCEEIVYDQNMLSMYLISEIEV